MCYSLVIYDAFFFLYHFLYFTQLNIDLSAFALCTIMFCYVFFSFTDIFQLKKKKKLIKKHQNICWKLHLRGGRIKDEDKTALLLWIKCTLRVWHLLTIYNFVRQGNVANLQCYISESKLTGEIFFVNSAAMMVLKEVWCFVLDVIVESLYQTGVINWKFFN